MENVKYNSGRYNVAIQGIDRANTSTYKELCIYPDREFIIYDWYWYMVYTCDMDLLVISLSSPSFPKLFLRAGSP